MSDPFRAVRFLCLAAGLLGMGELRAEILLLNGGGRIEGTVVKRTAESVFVDLGYTILCVPQKEVKEIRASGGEPGPAVLPPEGQPGSGSGGAVKPLPSKPTSLKEGAAPTPAVPGREAIYSTSELEAGSLKEKARDVAEGVVQVVCPGKLGSGFIINETEGFVITNCHVVEGDQDIAVVIYVREEHDFRKVRLEQVRLVALNPFLDLALLKIDPQEPQASGKGLRFRKVYLGDSDVLRVGDPVFAVGSPLGLERTVTEGIVSNNRRALGGLIYIQTSAPINPGNSGGPLFNDRGEVIGITSLKVTFGESLGFAIPVNYLKDFLRNREAFAFDKDHPNTGIRYLPPPRKRGPDRRQL
jgi:serine protease Do